MVVVLRKKLYIRTVISILVLKSESKDLPAKYSTVQLCATGKNRCRKKREQQQQKKTVCYYMTNRKIELASWKLRKQFENSKNKAK